MGNGINGQIPDGNDLALLTPGNGCAQPGTNTSNELGGAELIARIRARLRTPVSRREEGEVITVGDLTIDPVAHLVQLGGEEISLTPLEYSLLVTMAQYPNRVFSRETLLREVW